jgi:ABC-type sugar transport system substrate-binding protein
MKTLRNTSMKTVVSLAVTATLIPFLAACSDSSDGGSDSSKKASSDALDLAQQRVDAYSSPPASLADLGIDQPVSVPSEPVRMGYSTCQPAICATIGDGLDAAMNAIGGELVAFPDQGTADSVQQAMQNILDAGVDAVLTAGAPTEWYQAQLDQLNEDGTPVLNYATAAGFQPDDFYANFINIDDYYYWGVLMADYVAANSDGDCGTVLVHNVPAYPVLAKETQGVVDELKKVCPGSKVVQEDFSVEDLASGQSTTTTVSDAQKNPDTKWIISTLGATVNTSLDSALKSAGITGIKAVASSDDSPNLELIKSGTLQVAGIDFSPEFLAYRVVDAALRALDGQEPQEATVGEESQLDGFPDIGKGGVPYYFVTADNIDDPSQPTPPPFDDYAEQFEALWQK